MTGRGVLLDINGPVDLLVPDGRLVVAVDHVQLHLHVGVQRRAAPVRRADPDREFGPLIHKYGGNICTGKIMGAKGAIHSS